MKSLFASFIFVLLWQCAIGQQNDCIITQEYTIVVLGSSTSAGSGASTYDSAWVNRYRDYLQEINPANNVINLGVGGYNTYRIMPTGFVPPSGRPNPDPARNITAALAENPNAIIINMPSNDVSAGFSYNEQMFNLDTIVSIATQNDVDIWVCSTQPRNFNNQGQLDLQWEIKDSIYAFFNPYTIDFWTTIATPGYTIEPIYDSGDGIHLNDAGHGILANRVIQSPILDSALIIPDSVDYTLVDLFANPSVCGDSLTEVQLVVGNVGLDNTDTAYLVLETTNTTLSSSETDQYQYLTGIPSCTFDTVLFTINTYEAGNYQMNATVSNSADSNLLNNTTQSQISTTGHPTLSTLGDTLCDPGMAQLYALSQLNDSIFWYDTPQSTTSIDQGDVLNIPSLTSSAYYYAQAVRGNLFFSESLPTSLNSNIDYNGTMFDLIASDSLVIDSFDVKINSVGLQGVEIFYKSGSHLGFQSVPAAWTLLGDASVMVNDPNAWTTVPIGNLSISQGDTVGVYIQIENGGELSYQSLSTPQTRTTPELTMITGSGIAANFGNSYYPRDWSGSVHYHFGERPLGDCASEKIETVAFLSESTLNAGNDTIIDITDTLFVEATSGFTSYLWSNGSTSASTLLPAADYGAGVHYIDVYALDSIGCERYDQFVLAVADLVDLEEVSWEVSVTPNPTKNTVHVEAPAMASISFTDLQGSQVAVSETGYHRYSLNGLSHGFYLIHVAYSGQKTIKKVLKY